MAGSAVGTGITGSEEDCVGSGPSGISCVARGGALEPAPQASATNINTIVAAINGKNFRGEKSILFMRQLPAGSEAMTGSAVADPMARSAEYEIHAARGEIPKSLMRGKQQG